MDKYITRGKAKVSKNYDNSDTVAIECINPSTTSANVSNNTHVEQTVEVRNKAITDEISQRSVNKNRSCK